MAENISYRFKNPNSSHSEDSDSDSEMHWKRRALMKETESENGMDFVPASVPSPKSSARNGARKKFNNVWSSVLLEQNLTENLEHVNVKQGISIERGVESYDFITDEKGSDFSAESDGESRDEMSASEEMIEEEECEPSKKEVRCKSSRIEKENSRSSSPFDNESSVRLSLKRRLGTHPEPSHNKEFAFLNVEEEQIVEKLSERLEEPKIELLCKVVRVIGEEKALDLLCKTEDVEAAGGLLINNKTRRRTPGGVYLHLLRHDSRFTDEEKNKIFGDDKKEHQKKKKLLAKRRIKMWIPRPFPKENKPAPMETSEIPSVSGDGNLKIKTDNELEEGEIDSCEEGEIND